MHLALAVEHGPLCEALLILQEHISVPLTRKQAAFEISRSSSPKSCTHLCKVAVLQLLGSASYTCQIWQ